MDRLTTELLLDAIPCRVNLVGERVIKGRRSLQLGADTLILTPTADAIWDLCDGRRTVAEIVRALALAFHCSDSSLVCATIRQLADARVLGVVRRRPRKPREGSLRLRRLTFSASFDEFTVFGVVFTDLYHECMEETGTWIQDDCRDERLRRAMLLARSIVHSLTPEGNGWVECGVYRGFSALLACRLISLARPGFRGAGMHLVDGFRGLGHPSQEDLVGSADHSTHSMSHPPGHWAAREDDVRAIFSKHYPEAQIHQGWIPDVLETLPERTWSYVHLDLDLFEPTFCALEYFGSRMLPGGVIHGDDYDRASFPGVRTAWHHFASRHDYTIECYAPTQVAIRFRD